MKVFLIAVVVALSGCVSLGHEGRSIPQVALSTFEPSVKSIALDSDDHALGLAVEQTLQVIGYNVVLPNSVRITDKTPTQDISYNESSTRYVVRVRSDDWAGEICVPEGSRLMHSFSISVLDIRTQKRVFLLTGEDGCRNTVAAQLRKWMSK